MKLLLFALIMSLQAPLSMAKKCDVDLADYKENHLEFEYAISPDKEFYEILGSNIEGTKALISGKNTTYSSFSFSAKYNYEALKSKYRCPRPVDIKLLKGFNGVSHTDINGTFVKRHDSIILSDKTKASYLGKTLDGELVLNEFKSYRGTSKYRPHNLLIVPERTDLNLFLVDTKYENCSEIKMKELVEEKTRSKLFKGKNTDQLIRKCEKKGYTNCISGEFNHKVTEKFSLTTYLECKVKVHPYHKHACKAYATSNRTSSTSGVLGVEFLENDFYQENPNYCATLKKCSDSSKDEYEIAKFDLINKELRCF